MIDLVDLIDWLILYFSFSVVCSDNSDSDAETEAVEVDRDTLKQSDEELEKRNPELIEKWERRVKLSDAYGIGICVIVAAFNLGYCCSNPTVANIFNGVRQMVASLCIAYVPVKHVLR